MQLQEIKYTNASSDYESSGNGAFRLVSKLLTEALAGNYARVAVRAEAENLFYDPEAKIQTMGVIRVEIMSAEIKESGTSTEITMSGAVETHGKVRCKFTLYFLLKRTVAVIPRSVSYMETLTGTSFVMGVEKASANLHDSLFNLSISGAEASGKNYQLGEGRGFLVFSHGGAIIEN